MSTMNQEIIEQHNRICADRLSGATTLLREILNLIGQMVQQSNTEEATDQARRFAADFIESHPSMAQVINLCRDIIEIADDAGLMTWCIGNWQERIEFEQQETIKRAAQVCAPYNRILTLSHSRLVAETIMSMPLAPELIISESRPMNEGVILAKYLHDRGKEVRLVVDAALPGMVEEDDAVLIGADCMTSEFLVNKIGSLPLALACRRGYFHVPVIALCPSSKFLDPGRSIYYQILDQPPEELKHPLQTDLRVVNRYFEQVPLPLVSHIVHEKGVDSPAEFLAKIEEDPDE